MRYSKGNKSWGRWAGAMLLVLLPLSVLAAALFILYPRRYR